jgi:hypothetical protein
MRYTLLSRTTALMHGIMQNRRGSGYGSTLHPYTRCDPATATCGVRGV